MNTKMTLRLSAGGLLLLLAGFAITRLNLSTPRWEYSFITFQQPTEMRALYGMGAEGWEVVGFFRDWHTNQAVLLKKKL